MLLSVTCPNALGIYIALAASCETCVFSNVKTKAQIRKPRICLNAKFQTSNHLPWVYSPIVQSIISLTTSLRHQLVKYMPTEL